VDLDHLMLLLRRAIDHRRLRFENLLLRDEYQKRHGFPAIIGDSPPMRAVSSQIEKVAITDSTVLLLGESGTGKELFARALHELSPRREGPFIAINCAAIPDTLIENEFFGHEKGSYTGAVSRQMGKFELAESGTIFLDEIAELGLTMQTKILRVLQERRFERIGGVATLTANVRVICATNRDLDEEVRQGRFREDLFFRINVFPIVIPPLRARRADIDALVDHFLLKIGKEIGKSGVRISAEARQLLRDYNWPGNVRELENCIERGVILCERNTIEPKDLIIAPHRDESVAGIGSVMDLSGTLAEATSRAVTLVERERITSALENAMNRNEAAEQLGIGYRTLLNKMKELDIKDER
jgi:transcriptional regulator with GAF, ATPase, and Fis domain